MGASEGLNAASRLFSAQQDGRSHSVGFAVCTSDGIRASGGGGRRTVLLDIRYWILGKISICLP